MRRPSAALVCMLCTLCAWAAQAAEPLRNVEVKDPRPFGHFIGDTLTREVSFDVVKPWQLSPLDGAQKLGRTDPWVELIASHARVTELADGRRYRLTLTYQIVNAPAQSSLVTVAGLALHLVNLGDERRMPLPDWLLTLTPLTGSELRQGMDAQLASRSPRPIETRRLLWRAVGFGTLGALLTLWFALERWGFAAFSPLAGPFGTAVRELKRLRRRPASRERDQEALRLLHRAFDATARQRVFGERLDAFFVQYPEFTAQQRDIRQFFDTSRQEFFGAGATGAMSLPNLVALSERLRLHERSAGRRHVAAV